MNPPTLGACWMGHKPALSPLDSPKTRGEGILAAFFLGGPHI